MLLYKNNQEPEIKIRRRIHLTIASKATKYLGMDLKLVKDMYFEN